MAEKKIFDDWINYIAPNVKFDFKYKTSYATSIFITQYTLENTPSYQCELIDAYPIAVNQLDLDWSSDGYHKLTVVFAYTYYKYTNY